jgi:isopentenyl-diphosphate Delta-isomerase
VAHINVN